MGVVGLLEPDFIYDMLRQQVNGRWVVVALRILPRPTDWETRVEKAGPPNLEDPNAPRPTAGLSARHLREISFDGRPIVPLFNQAQKIAEKYEKPGPVGPFGTGKMRLARIADLYVRALEAASRRPNVDVAKRLGISSSAVRDAVHHARVQGLLTKTRKNGVVGGELTATAVALLKLDKAGESSGDPAADGTR
jgi:hypothetical protein